MRNYKLYLILFLAIFLRLNYDTFIPGYNYDEIAMMSTAVQSFPLGILKTAATNDYHAPLYPLIAHFFTYFENEWVYLRLFNIILSLINIYVFYKVGCLIKDKNTGYILALILTVNHLEISTVSFIKFYCLAFLLVSLSTYYFIKIIKAEKGYRRLGFFNLLLILTSTYGFIFVGIEYLYLLFKSRNKKLYISILISLAGFLLYLPILVNQILLNFTNVFSPHSYYIEFAPVSLYNAINDYTAPLLNYCCNLATVVSLSVLLHFLESVRNHQIEFHYLIIFVLFSILPVVIAILFFIKGIYNNKHIKEINIVSFLFLFTFIIMTKLQLTGFVPIYIYPFAIILLISMGAGVNTFKNKKLAIALFVIYIFINLFISNCYPPDKREYLAPKLYNCVEKFYKDNPDIKLLTTSGGRFVAKYYKNKTIFDFDSEKIKGSFGKKYISLVFGDNVAKKINKKNAYDIIVPLMIKKYRSTLFEDYFVKNVYDKLNHGEKIAFCFSAEEDNTFIDKYEEYMDWIQSKPYRYRLGKATIKEAMSDEINYIDTALLSQAIESYSYEYLINLLDKYFKRIKFEQYTRLPNDTWIKVYEDNSNTYSTLYLAQNANKSWIFVTYQKQ